MLQIDCGLVSGSRSKALQCIDSFAGGAVGRASHSVLVFLFDQVAKEAVNTPDTGLTHSPAA